VSQTPLTAPPLGARSRAAVAIPFIIVTLVWSSTWLVIRDQLGVVPPNWSVAYRFAVAAVTLLVFGVMTGVRFRLDRRGHLLALAVGLSQFAINFNFVYRAEAYVTSGLVAVVFALLIVPNAILGWLLLRQGLSRPFLIGSVVAIGGVALLFRHEMLNAELGGDAVLAGIGFSMLGVLCASLSNVLQATPTGRAQPMIAMLVYAMLWGAAANAVYAWAIAGPPVFDPRIGYVAGIAYLGMIGSALTFPLYFQVIRDIGPARAAYSGVLIPVIAMALSTLFEGYRWSWEAVLGGLLTLAGLVIALKARSPAR